MTESGNWNTRSVKHILTNPTYTGILVQGKNKRVVENTHEALIDNNSFEIVQKNLQSKILNVETKSQSTENLLKGKVICGCCGRKMQRKRGTNHANWYFFTCNTNNRIGSGKCTGMYIREQEIFDEIQQQLKLFVKEHSVSDMEYQNKKEELEKEIMILTTKYNIEKEKFQQCYKMLVNKKITEEQFYVYQENFEKVKRKLKNVVTEKLKYDEQYQIFLKLDSASKKELVFSKVMDDIEEICIYQGKKVVVKWAKLF